MSSVLQPQPIAQPTHLDHQGCASESMEMTQPKVYEPMGMLDDPTVWIYNSTNKATLDPQRPQESFEPELSLRGGEDCGGWCRGRFCFLIPCPIPIRCCVIPL
jgi:hypothetical protein